MSRTALALGVLAAFLMAGPASAAMNLDPGLELWSIGAFDPADDFLELDNYQYFWNADNRVRITREETEVYEGNYACRLGGTDNWTSPYGSSQHGTGICTDDFTKAMFGGDGGTVMVSFKYKVVVAASSGWEGLRADLATGLPVDPWGGQFANGDSIAPTAVSADWETYNFSHVLAAGDPDTFHVNVMNWGGYAQNGAAIVIDDLQVTPEPATMALLSIGGAALILRRRK